MCVPRPGFLDRLKQRLAIALCLAAKPRDKRVEQFDIAGEIPRLDERRTDRGVGAGKLAGIADRAHALPQHEPHIVHVAHQAFGQRPHPRGRVRRVQNHQVDIRERRDIPAAVTAMRNECNVLAESVGPRVVEIGQRLLEQRVDDRVEQLGLRPADLHARRALFVPSPQFGATLGQLLLDRQHVWTQTGGG